MKYIANILYLEFQEALLCGIPEGTIKAALARESASWSFINDPSDSRKVLIQYSTLKETHKALVVAKFGDPYQHLASQIIKQQLINKQEDTQFITTFTLPDGTNLPANKQSDYITACSVLNLLSSLNARGVRALGYNSSADFYQALCGIIKSDSICLPASYPKLKAKVAEYKVRGAVCVISKKWCNGNAKKISDEVSEATLLELISHHAQFDDSFICRKYNKWAEASGYKTIVDVTVGNYRRKNLLTVTASREGQKPWHNQFTPITKRFRPTAPLYLINSDDNTLDLYFREGNNPYFRFTLVVVVDTFNDYPLGYAVGRSQTTELVQAAFLDAIHHVREMTGEQLLWKQIQTDSWGLKQLREWYERQATFTPTKTGNARGKVIEQSFGKSWHTMLRAYPNYAGYNITAQEQRNADAIQRNVKDFPTIEEGIHQIAHFINRLRTEVDERKGISKQQQWLEAYTKMLPEQKRQLSHTDRLLLFGTPHNYTNKLTASGFNVAYKRQQITYDVTKEDYIKHIGKTMQIHFDPYDLTQVLATMEDGRVRVLCQRNKAMPMAIADMQDGDRALLNVKLREKKEIGQYALDAQTKRRLILEENRIDAEGLLQAGVLVKDQRHLAESNYYESLAQEDMQLTEPIQDNDDEDIFDKMMRLENDQD